MINRIKRYLIKKINNKKWKILLILPLIKIKKIL